MQSTERAFVLTDQLLAKHRAGRLLCLDLSAVGAAHTALADAPTGFRIVRASGENELRQLPDVLSDPKGADVPPSGDPSSEEQDSDDLVSGPAVAIVRVSGMLMSEPDTLCGFFDGYGGEEGLVARFAEAHASAYVAGVVMHMTTPGGDSMGCGEAAAAMRAAAMASGKPTIVAVEGRCLSAGYWLAAHVGDAILVTEGSDVGSIGCWSLHCDASKANEKEGLAYTYIADPPEKVAGHGDAPLDDEGRARLERGVKDVTARFVRDVAAGRARAGHDDLDVDALRATKADTRRGPAAVEADLADGMGTLADAVSLCALRALAKAPAPPPDIPPPPPPNPEPQPGTPAMKLTASPALVAAAGTTDPVAFERRVLAALTLERDLLGETGQSTAEGAVGVLRAWKRDAAGVPELRTKLAAAEGVAEESERIKLLETATTGRAPKLSEREAFVWEVVADPASKDGLKRDAEGKPLKERRVAPAYAAPATDAQGRPIGFTLAALRAHLDAKAAVAPLELGGAGRAADPAAVIGDLQVAATLPAEQVRALRGRRPDIDASKFAALHAQIHAPKE